MPFRESRARLWITISDRHGDSAMETPRLQPYNVGADGGATLARRNEECALQTGLRAGGSGSCLKLVSAAVGSVPPELKTTTLLHPAPLTS